MTNYGLNDGLETVKMEILIGKIVIFLVHDYKYCRR